MYLKSLFLQKVFSKIRLQQSLFRTSICGTPIQYINMTKTKHKSACSAVSVLLFTRFSQSSFKIGHLLDIANITKVSPLHTPLCQHLMSRHRWKILQGHLRINSFPHVMLGVFLASVRIVIMKHNYQALRKFIPRWFHLCRPNRKPWAYVSNYSSCTSAGYIWRGLVLRLQPAGVCVWRQNPEDLGRQLGKRADELTAVWAVRVDVTLKGFTLIIALTDLTSLVWYELLNHWQYNRIIVLYTYAAFKEPRNNAQQNTFAQRGECGRNLSTHRLQQGLTVL